MIDHKIFVFNAARNKRRHRNGARGVTTRRNVTRNAPVGVIGPVRGRPKTMQSFYG
jgi:hypothetical protein